MKPLLYERVAHANGFINESVPFVIDKDTLMKCWRLAPLPELPAMAIIPYQQTWIELDRGKLGALVIGTEKTLVLSFFDRVIVETPIIVMVFRDGERRAQSGFIEELRATVDVRTFPPAVAKALVSQVLGANDVPYADEVSVCTFENTARHRDDGLVMQDMLLWTARYKGIVTCVMTVLAAIAYGPTKKTEMAPSGRWLAKQRHGYKSLPFVKHTVVRIEMEEKLFHRTLRNEAEHAHKRQHDERSQPRIIRRGRPDEYTVIVKSHKRGDPSLGQIIHDAYATTRTERK